MIDEQPKKHLDPNDPTVFTNPSLIKMLGPREQMIAIINLAQSGQMLDDDQIKMLETLLARAGYVVNVDGVFSEEELAALQNFENKLNDKDFRSAAEELIAMMTGAASVEEIKLPTFDTTDHHKGRRAFAKSAAQKVILGLEPED